MGKNGKTDVPVFLAGWPLHNDVTQPGYAARLRPTPSLKTIQGASPRKRSGDLEYLDSFTT